MGKKKYKLNIKNVLYHIDIKDKNYYRNLTEDQQKEFTPFTTMRWLSGTKDIRQIVFLNELVNCFVFHPNISKHKEFLYFLMIICSSGTPHTYFYNKTASKLSSKALNIIKEYFEYSTKQAYEVLPLLSKEDIISYANELGKQKDEIKILEKELL